MKLANLNSPHWAWDFVESNRNLNGLEIDYSTFKITFRPTPTTISAPPFRVFLGQRPVPQEGKVGRLPEVDGEDHRPISRFAD